jgi:hypothetical protein
MVMSRWLPRYLGGCGLRFGTEFYTRFLCTFRMQAVDHSNGEGITPLISVCIKKIPNL